MILLQKIEEYKESKDKNQPEIIKLKQEIVKELLNLGYQTPQKYYRLQEEDAGEFVLEVAGEIDSLIENFQPQLGNFMHYFNKYLYKKVRFFYYKRNESDNVESIVMEKYSFSEGQPQPYTGFITDNSSSSSSDNSNSIITKLLFAFAKNKKVHGRFFLLAMTVMPFMSLSSVIDICNTFRFDIPQTVKLCERFSAICEEQIKEKEKLEEKRNYYWRRGLILSEKISSYGSSDLSDKKLDAIYSLESNRKKHEQKCLELQTKIPKVPHTVLAKELGIKLKSLNSTIHNIKSFIAYIKADTSLDELKKQKNRKGKNIQILKEIAGINFQKSDFSKKEVAVFKPMDFFNLKVYS